MVKNVLNVTSIFALVLCLNYMNQGNKKFYSAQLHDNSFALTFCIDTVGRYLILMPI